jgi:hypothetical protein
MHIANRIPNRTHTFVDPYVMENTIKNTELEKFVDDYKQWLEQKPTSDKIDYVDFHGLCILKSEEENGLETKVMVNGTMNNVTASNALLMYKEIESNVMKSSFKKINQLLEEKVLSNP